MASKFSLNELFCQCSVCLKQYKEPRLLPCLHRYCSHCLKTLCQNNCDEVQCPQCSDRFPLPSQGVDGLKLDFNMKNIIEYLQFQKSLHDDKIRECCGCSEKVKSTAYCFKCNDFLCHNCQKLHQSNKLLKDHKPYVTLLTKSEHKNLTLGLFNVHKEPPKCQTHSEAASQLCCKTCGNRPICVPCSYGTHKNHDIGDITTVVESEKERLTAELIRAQNWKEEASQNVKTLKENEKTIFSNASGKAQILKFNYEKESSKIEMTMTTLRDDNLRSNTEVENKVKSDIKALQKQMEMEIQEIKNKYNKSIEKTKKNSTVTLSELEKKFQSEEKMLLEERKVLSKDFENSLKTLQKQEKELLGICKEETVHYENVHKRLENVLITGNSILAGNNNWTIVQCVPDVCAAIQPLGEKMKREFLKLEVPSQTEVLGPPTDEGDNVPAPVGECKESVIDIEGIKDKDWHINSITGTGDGNFIITGNSSTKELHITLIDVQGKRKRQKITVTEDPVHRWSYCDFLSNCKVVIISSPFKVGIYDVIKGTYFVSNITEVISNWPKQWFIRCVATEPRKHLIYVSAVGTKDIYVLNNQLIYQSQMRIPDMIQWPQAFKISDGKLLLCGSTDKACAVDMKTSEKVLYEFPKPGIPENSCTPISICVDKKKFIYILWSQGAKCILVKYSQRGGRIKKTKLVDSNASCVATVEMDNTEKIIVATETSRKVYIYELLEL